MDAFRAHNLPKRNLSRRLEGHRPRLTGALRLGWVRYLAKASGHLQRVLVRVWQPYTRSDIPATDKERTRRSFIEFSCLIHNC
jgi:hypothetical protein